MLVLHSQKPVVVLHLSALPVQCESSKQLHAGWSGNSVRFMHRLPVSHGTYPLKLHEQLVGIEVVLQVSELSRQSEASKQEHAGCPTYVVRLRQILSSSQTSELLLAAHPQLAGLVPVLQVSELSPRQSSTVRHEHAGCPVTF